VDGHGSEFLTEDVYSFLGHQVGVRSDSQRVLEYLRATYGRFYLGPQNPPGSQYTAGDDGHRHTVRIIEEPEASNQLVYNDGYRLCRFTWTGAYSQLSCQDLRPPHSANSYILEFADPLSFVNGALLRTVSTLLEDYHLFHAGAVSLDGQGIILPGGGGLGKTTIVLKLVMLGCRFLSDEIACINRANGLLQPFPRQVNVRDPSPELLGLTLEKRSAPYPVAADAWQWSLDIERIAPACLSPACRLHHLMFLGGYGDEPRLDVLATSNALFRLWEHSVDPVEDPPAHLFELAGLLQDVRCYSLVAGAPGDTARLVIAAARGAER
jgi:hypothetical protein